MKPLVSPPYAFAPFWRAFSGGTVKSPLRMASTLRVERTARRVFTEPSLAMYSSSPKTTPMYFRHTRSGRVTGVQTCALPIYVLSAEIIQSILAELKAGVGLLQLDFKCFEEAQGGLFVAAGEPHGPVSPVLVRLGVTTSIGLLDEVPKNHEKLV